MNEIKSNALIIEDTNKYYIFDRNNDTGLINSYPNYEIMNSALTNNYYNIINIVVVDKMIYYFRVSNVCELKSYKQMFKSTNNYYYSIDENRNYRYISTFEIDKIKKANIIPNF